MVGGLEMYLFMSVSDAVWSAEFACFAEDVLFLGYLMPGRNSFKRACSNVMELFKCRCGMSEKVHLFLLTADSFS